MNDKHVSSNAVINLLGDLSECQEDNVWHTLMSCENLMETASWEEIMGFIFYVYEKNDDVIYKIPTVILDKQSFNFLEKLNVDFNHVDRSGRNFLHYFLSCRESSEGCKLKIESYPDYYGIKRFVVKTDGAPYIGIKKAVDYLFKKTTDLNLKDKQGKNILFYYTDLIYSGVDGKDFKNLCAQYPELDVNVRNNFGINLLEQAIRRAAIPVAEYLLERGVDFSGYKDDDLFVDFLYSSPSEESELFFKKIMTKVDLVLTEDGRIKNNNFFRKIKEWNDLDKNSKSIQERTKSWLNICFDSIIDRNFKYTKDGLDILQNEIKILENTKSLNEDIEFREINKVILSLKINNELVKPEIYGKIRNKI